MQFWGEIPDIFSEALACRETCRIIAEWDTVVYQVRVAEWEGC